MYQIIGIKRIDFKPKDQDNEIKGYKVYVVMEERGVQGYKPDELFMSDRMLERTGYTPGLDDRIEVLFNRYGKVDRVELAEDI